MLRFFREEVLQPRFPRSAAEGAIKAMLLAGMILGPYDALSPIPETKAEWDVMSQNILKGYGLFILTGVICGLIGNYCLHNQREEPQIRR